MFKKEDIPHNIEEYTVKVNKIDDLLREIKTASEIIRNQIIADNPSKDVRWLNILDTAVEEARPLTEEKEEKRSLGYINTDYIPDGEFKDKFFKWMYGQTVPSIKGVRFAVYIHDFERFYDLEVSGTPTYWD